MQSQYVQKYRGRLLRVFVQEWKTEELSLQSKKVCIYSTVLF